MSSFLKKLPIQVPLEDLYPDPNNPRLALPGKPGYEDSAVLFSEETRDKIFGYLGEAAYAVDDLIAAIVGQGWLPVDNIIVWRHPDHDGPYVVLEGNRRRLALERIRTERLERQRHHLERMEKRPGSFDAAEIEAQQGAVAGLEEIVADTSLLSVYELDAETVEDLRRKLPRILAVRHITGTKGWGRYAEDLWLLERFNQLFAERHGSDTTPFWDDEVTARVADEASLAHTKTRWHLKSSSWFSRFRSDFEEQLPGEEQFRPGDYYLFELIAQRQWVKERFEIADEDFRISDRMSQVIFDWVFKHPRPASSDENPNVFYKHENIQLWDRMKRWDDQHGTDFASRFDPREPEKAPTMHEVEAEWLPHKARQEPQKALAALLRRLGSFKADDLAGQGASLRAQLEEVREKADRFLKMIDASEG